MALERRAGGLAHRPRPPVGCGLSSGRPGGDAYGYRFDCRRGTGSRFCARPFLGLESARRLVSRKVQANSPHRTLRRSCSGVTYMKQNSPSPKLAVILLASSIAAASACKTAPPLSSGIDVAGMDKSVTPGDDFNAYANGGWMKATPIPADKAIYGIFSVLADETRKRLLALIQESAKAGSATDSDTRKVGDFYSSFMDEAAIER